MKSDKEKEICALIDLLALKNGHVLSLIQMFDDNLENFVPKIDFDTIGRISAVNAAVVGFSNEIDEITEKLYSII